MRYNNNQFAINFNSHGVNPDKITKGIFFAGGGGWSQGMKEIEEIQLRWILNHDRIALRTSSYHNKGVKVFWSDVYMQDEKEMEPVDMVQASLECDEHTDANPRELKEESSYTMGWELYRYIPHLNPLVISIENVPGFKRWAPLDENKVRIKERAGEEFERWKQAVMDLGYEYTESIRVAADDGLPTTRERFFCFFYRPGIDIQWPEYTHSETGEDGLLKWEACRPYIDLEDEGMSIFGRTYDMSLPKNLRRKLVPNSLKRIAGGIKKQYPNYAKFLCKYHAGQGKEVERSYSLDEPCRAIDTSNRHQLTTVNGMSFIADHCHTDNYQSLDEPMRPQLTWQTKTLVRLEKLEFLEEFFSDLDNMLSKEEDESNALIVQHYGGSIQSNGLSDPLPTAVCRDVHMLVRLEKLQFLVQYFNSNGNPEYNNQSLDEPLSTVLTKQKHALITLLDNFDIKVRFLRAHELAGISTFPVDYFSHKELKLSQKDAIVLIGNAVPPKWGTILIKPNVPAILAYKNGMTEMRKLA